MKTYLCQRDGKSSFTCGLVVMSLVKVFFTDIRVYLWTNARLVAAFGGGNCTLLVRSVLPWAQPFWIWLRNYASVFAKSRLSKPKIRPLLVGQRTYHWGSVCVWGGWPREDEKPFDFSVFVCICCRPFAVSDIRFRNQETSGGDFAW